MNPKFYALPQAKQEAIIQAGFRVFGQHAYKKAPMSAIADAAGIPSPCFFIISIIKRNFTFSSSTS